MSIAGTECVETRSAVKAPPPSSPRVPKVTGAGTTPRREALATSTSTSIQPSCAASPSPNLDELPKDFEFQSELCFYNPTLHRIARILLTEVEICGVHGALFAESLATALIALLLKAQQPSRAALPSPSRAQATERIRVVCEYIEGNLGSDLHLEQLGRIAGLGPDRFGELFRISTGVSPYRYVLQRKIERAKAMLLRREIPIAQIALDLGFADHAHLSSTFRRLTGTMPSRFRSEAVR